MNKLLTANFSRMFKDKLFWIGTIFMAIMGIWFPLMNYRTMIRNDDLMYIDSSFFMGAFFIGVILSIFCGLFIGTEYNDGTIRNKIIVGQKRTSIYLSNLLVCVSAGIIMCTVCFVSCLCIGLPLFGSFQTELKIIIQFMLCVLLLSTAFSSLFTSIAMISQSKTTSAVACILTAFLLIFAATYIRAQLAEPEMYDSYTYMDEIGNMVTDEAQPNLNYVSGTKREVYEFLNDFLLGGQSLQITQMSGEKPWLFMLYSGITIVATTGAGILIFRKKDLK